MRFKRLKYFRTPIALLIVVSTVLFAACRKKDDPDPEPEETVFDKQGMLVNIADNLIIPSFTELRVAFDSLHKNLQDFTNSGSITSLQRTRTHFQDAWFKYQRVSIHGFGPGDDAGVRVNFNVFPADTTKIQKNITAGVYDLSSAANIATKGFPALEYLLYGKGRSDQGISDAFVNSAARRKYAQDLSKEMSDLTATMLNTWNAGYRNTFVSSLGSDVGSSIGFLINQLNFELDYLKNSKLATPLGLRSGGAPLPEMCEAYYSGFSVKYAVETLNAIENLYRGRSFVGIDKLGFDDYITHLDAQHVNGSLAAAIDAQFAIAKAKLNAIPDPLSSQVITNKAVVEDAYRELVKLLALLKSDLPSVLGVMITYQDGDGD
jgi:predicted lipoprotein